MDGGDEGREGEEIEGEGDRDSADEEEAIINETEFAESMGYVGDGDEKSIPLHNVPFTGPKIVWSRNNAPKRALDFFLLYFSFELMEAIIANSNLYAVHGKGIGATYLSQNHGHLEWRPIDLMEFRRFLACLFYMGIVKAPARENYWQSDRLFSGLLGSMFVPTFRRYCGILAALHCVNPASEDANDPLGKIRNVYDHMRSKCKELFIPGQKVSIDERMVKSKGRFFFKQYIMNKPTKWGFKLWVLADSSTGYNWDMVVYTGKRKDGWDDFSVNESSFERLPSDISRSYPDSNDPDPDARQNLMLQLGARVVLKLTMPLVNRGYILFVDNFYTSVPLFMYLSSVGINAVGTIRENTTGFPVELKNRGAWGKKLERGTIRFKRIGEAPNDVLLIQWVDRNIVSVLSTYHSANDYGYCRRNMKENGVHKKCDILRPKCIKDYNQDMNGVDLSDQMYRMYSVQYRTRKFWKTLFFHFLDIAAWNAFVFWRELKDQLPSHAMPSTYSFLDFKKDLVLQLACIEQSSIDIVPHATRQNAQFVEVDDVDEFMCNATSHAVDSAKKAGSSIRMKQSRDELWGQRLGSGHLPVKLSKPQTCKVCSVILAAHGSKSPQRPKRSTFSCVLCDIPLCIGDRNCFVLFHSSQFDMYKDIFLEHCRHH